MIGREKERCNLVCELPGNLTTSGAHSAFCPCHIPLVLTTHILWYHFCFPSPPSQPPTQYRICSPALAEGVGKGKPCLISEHTAEKGLAVTGMSVMLRTSTALRFFHVQRQPCASLVWGAASGPPPPPPLCAWLKSKGFSHVQGQSYVPLLSVRPLGGYGRYLSVCTKGRIGKKQTYSPVS